MKKLSSLSLSHSASTLPCQENHQQEDGNDEEEEEQFEERARCEWDFTLSAYVSSTSTGPISDTLGVIEFNPSGTHFATGGIARKIRIYNLNSLLSSSVEAAAPLDHSAACQFYMITPAKLSSLRWKPGSDGRVIGSADYDGVVMEYDLEKRMPVFERDEHNGRRVWSMDYSHWDPVVGASGSDDGTMQMWDPRCDGGKCVATVQPSVSGSPVCCVEFNPYGGALVAIGCADRKAYGYDVRKMVDPVLVFDGHQKSVTYTRFLDHHTVVTSGIDGCLKMWDTDDQRLVRTYKGHTNRRRFVGLSVWRDHGLISSGSESNQVFVYDKRWGEPIWVHGFDQQGGNIGCDGWFVSSVCWRQHGEDGCTLVGGGCDGVLQVFSGKQKPL